MNLFTYLSKNLNLLLIKIFLSQKIRNRADKYFKMTIRDFKNKNHRKPNRDELFLLVVKTSHRTIGVKKIGGYKGHIKRQQIRKYLLLSNNLRNNYKIQR